jgi:hypothetical protein
VKAFTLETLVEAGSWRLRACVTLVLLDWIQSLALDGIRVTRPVTMAFATNTLVNGEWTTRTIDVNAVLRHYDQQDKEASANAMEVERPPVLGLLTQTVIRSPLVHWILPVRLRDLNTNDVAFIGVGELSSIYRTIAYQNSCSLFGSECGSHLSLFLLRLFSLQRHIWH